MTEPTNASRAHWARLAIQAYASATRHSVEGQDLNNEENLTEVLGDLLGDLRHAVGTELFDQCSERGLRYYEEELAEEAAEVTDEHPAG